MSLICSGLLLATVAPQAAPNLVAALQAKLIAPCEIGWMIGPCEGLKLKTKEGLRDLPMFKRDELARFFGEGSSRSDSGFQNSKFSS